MAAQKEHLLPIGKKRSFGSIDEVFEHIRARFWKVGEGKFVTNCEGHIKLIDESDRRNLGDVLVESKKDCLYDLVLVTPKILEYKGVVFKQGESRIVDNKVNLWGREVVEDWYRIFRGWVIYSLCSGDKEKADTVLSWISDKCRHPEIRPKKAIALVRKSNQAHFFFSLVLPYFCYGTSVATGCGNFVEASEIPWDVVYIDNIDLFSATELKEMTRPIEIINSRGLEIEVNDARGFVFGSKNGDFRKLPKDYVALEPVDLKEYSGLFLGKTGNDEFWQKIKGDLLMRW
jgi:hypothetical protein